MDTPRGLSGMSVLLAEVSKRSYADKGVMLSAVVLSKKNGMPGPGFFKLARDAGWKPPGDENDSFFYKELRRAQRKYREG